MEVLKVINNNIVVSLDENQKEAVVMGRGLGFKKKPLCNFISSFRSAAAAAFLLQQLSYHDWMQNSFWELHSREYQP